VGMGSDDTITFGAAVQYVTLVFLKNYRNISRAVMTRIKPPISAARGGATSDIRPFGMSTARSTPAAFSMLANAARVGSAYPYTQYKSLFQQAEVLFGTSGITGQHLDSGMC